MTDATEAVARALSLCRYGTEESWQPFTDEAHDAIIALDRHRIERAGEVAKALCNDSSDQPYTERHDAAALIATLRAELETERYNRADMARARQEGWNAAIDAAAPLVASETIGIYGNPSFVPYRVLSDSDGDDGA